MNALITPFVPRTAVKPRFLLLFALVSLIFFRVQAQKTVRIPTPPAKVTITMQGNLIIDCTILGRVGDTILVEDVMEKRYPIDIRFIKRIDLRRDKADSTSGFIPSVVNPTWFENPNATRNFFAPTGFGLRKGEGYYQNVMIAIHQISYGFTDYFTLGAGFDIIGPIAGDWPLMMYITPKLSFPVVKNLNVGVGALAGSFGGSLIDGQRTNAGIVYGVVTYGNRDNNATVGIGYGYERSNWSQKPAITVGGQVRLAKKFAIMTENYFIQGFNLLTLGCRYMNTSFTFDFGIGRLLEEEFSGISMPYLSVTFPFKVKKVYAPKLK